MSSYDFRFVKRDGKLILQLREEMDDGGTYWSKWEDVRVEEENSK